MLFFKKILHLSKEEPKPSDKRGAPRYAVGPSFPFKLTMSFVAHDQDGCPIPGNLAGQDWAGRLRNLSATGASVQMHSAAIATRGEPCKFKLSLDGYLLEIPGTVAHFHCYPQYVLCGVNFEFPDIGTQSALRQVLEPVAIGASLEPVEPKKIKQDTPGLHKEQFKKEGKSMLTVWRPEPEGKIHSFDFRLNDYGVRWVKGMAELRTYVVDQTAFVSGSEEPHLEYNLTEAQKETVHWLFCLAVPNLSKSVPADVRDFLTELVS